jgi:AcrR family transcriptional regulator
MDGNNLVVNTATKNPSRAESTRDQLMRAAEKLFSIHGIGNVSVRSIIAEAGQKNESALQYHFGNRAGLFSAIQKQRNHQIDLKRRELLKEMRLGTRTMTVRDVCILMVKPAFLLCRSDTLFRDFLGAFGQMILSSSQPVVLTLQRQEAEVMNEIKNLLGSCVPQLDADMLAVRFEDTARFATQSISLRAREKLAFRGKNADFFISNLIDTMAAMMAAKVSKETQALR